MIQFKKYLLFVTFICFSYTFACINGVEKGLSTGTTLYIDHEGLIPYGHEFWLNKENRDLEKLDSLYQVKPDVKYLTEKGIVLIVQKDYKNAIKLYLEIEKKTPNLYSTASNLGTAYELAGDNENALKWISRALEINPDSHNKSEWIHVNILKIKLEQLQFLPEKLIGVDFGEENFPQSKLSKQEIEALIKQMYFQINERISFVKPKDDIMAQLLFEYGNLLLLDNKKTEANEVYNMAIKYGFNSSLIQERLELSNVDEKSTKNNVLDFLKSNWDTILITVLAILIFYFVFKAKERKNKN